MVHSSEKIIIIYDKLYVIKKDKKIHKRPTRSDDHGDIFVFFAKKPQENEC